MKHKHAGLIKAWADGAEIEVWNTNVEKWLLCGSIISWDECREFRIKPEPKPDVVKFFHVDKKHIVRETGQYYSHLKLIWDGETGVFKGAEVLK